VAKEMERRQILSNQKFKCVIEQLANRCVQIGQAVRFLEEKRKRLKCSKHCFISVKVPEGLQATVGAKKQLKQK